MIAIVYDVQSPVAAKVAEGLEEKGWKVVRKSFGQIGENAGNDCEAADLLVINADLYTAPSDDDVDEIFQYATDRMFDIHKVIDAYVPCLYKGKMKRIALVSERDASVRLCREKNGYAKRMVLAGLNMKFKMLFNKYRKDGFSIHCFALSSEEVKQGFWNPGEGLSPIDYICMNFSDDPEEVFMHSEENNFVMRNKWFEEVEW